MSDLFLQAKNFSTSRDMPKVNVNDAIYVDRFELDSYGHWQFLGDTPLVDRVNARVMSQKTEATVAPVFKADGVELTSSLNSGLISDFIDGANSYTQISVVKVSNVTVVTSIHGALVSTNTASSSAAYSSSGNVYLHIKPSSAASVPLITINTPAIVANDFMLIAHSIDKLSRKSIGYYLNGENEKDASNIMAIDYASNSMFVGLGNTYYHSANSGKLTVLETVIFDRALSLDQIKSAANRIKTRINNTLGITI